MVNSRKWNRIFCLFIYVFFAVYDFWMAAQVPYSFDDWDWGLSVGIDQWLNATLNSRYVGNAFVVAMTRSEFVKVLVMGSCFFLIPFALSVLAAMCVKNNRKKCCVLGFIVCNCLILAMDRDIWTQTYGWISGFANYVVSALFLMFWLYHIVIAFEEDIDRTYDKSIGKAVLFFVLAAADQLFIENLAVYNMLLAAFLCGVYFVRKRRIPVSVISSTAGALAGLLIMFSSSIYNDLFNHGVAVNGLRHLAWAGEWGATFTFRKFFRQTEITAQYTFANNLVACVLICILMAALIFFKYNASKKKKYLFIAANAGFVMYFLLAHVFVDFYEIYKTGTHIDMLPLFFVNAAFFALILFEIILCFGEDRLKMTRLLTVWVSAPAVAAPLILVLTDGGRLIYTSNIFLYFFALIIMCNVVQLIPEKITQICAAVAVAGLLVLLCDCTITHIRTGEYKRERVEMIAEAVETGADELVLPKAPPGSLLWRPDPNEPHRLVFFKEFYGIPEDVEVTFE